MADVDGTASLALESVETLWDDLDKCVLSQCESHGDIDDALREWLELTTQIRDRFPETQIELATCCTMLLQSRLFVENADYIRTQIIHSLLQEDDDAPLHAISCLLFIDGHHDESTFPRMVDEGCFPRLVELVNNHSGDEDVRLHRLLLQLLYETSRIQRLDIEDLALVDDAFIHHLFRIIEGVSSDAHDPYHYPTIRVLLVLNEQYMLASTDSSVDAPNPSAPLTNRIVKGLSLHGPLFRTFGENIILLLNRETETSLQLLILKLLYLLFTTKATYEYFYTNDLRVLVDVIIRNLMDLPDEKMSLRHTYLRVLYPLLAHTQLSQPPYYKQDEVIRVLRLLRGSQNAHFAPADETTLRLVDRVTKVNWLQQAEEREEEEATSASVQTDITQKFLGISLSPSQYESSVSVGDVAGVMERPGVQTPSRNTVQVRSDSADAVTMTQDYGSPTAKTKKQGPAVPKHRYGTPFTQSQVTNGAAKKIPPKAPPPRRGNRMKVVEQLPAEPIQETLPEHET